MWTSTSSIEPFPWALTSSYLNFSMSFGGNSQIIADPFVLHFCMVWTALLVHVPPSVPSKPPLASFKDSLLNDPLRGLWTPGLFAGTTWLTSLWPFLSSIFISTDTSCGDLHECQGYVPKSSLFVNNCWVSSQLKWHYLGRTQIRKTVSSRSLIYPAST